ncbi:MAG: glycosyltransferase family 1 protein [Patescibacteria group bacterium]|jgi:glycosyltransferase involved in cell wall biosynthesis
MSVNKNSQFNIAFEISPLLLASGSFGDKSGVYRYYYGLMKALSFYIRKNNKNAKIILFTFNRDLLFSPINKDILDLLKDPVFLFINDTLVLNKNYSFVMYLMGSFFRPFFKIINKILPIKKLYFNIINELRFQKYISFLNKEFIKHKVSIVYHSETCFYPMKNYKNVITIYDLTPITMSQYHRFETIDLFRRKLFFAQKYCQGIVCISKSTKRDLLKYYPVFAHKEITICYPGIDPIFFSKHDSLFEDLSKTAAQQVDSLKKNRYLFFYSTFEPRKNIINLVQAFFDLQNEGLIPEDFKLVLLGGEGWGKIKKRVINFIKENYLVIDKNKIIVFDFLNDYYLIDLIKNSYAVVYPSLYEGFGLPILEAMFLGAPVISSNSSSLPEVGEKSVLYFNPYDYYDLKDKIKYLINNPKIAQQLGQLGTRQSQKFNWNTSITKLYKYLTDL